MSLQVGVTWSTCPVTHDCSLKLSPEWFDGKKAFGLRMMILSRGDGPKSFMTKQPILPLGHVLIAATIRYQHPDLSLCSFLLLSYGGGARSLITGNKIKMGSKEETQPLMRNNTGDGGGKPFYFAPRSNSMSMEKSEVR